MIYLLVLAFAATLCGQKLEGVIDVHVHCHPDVIPRSIDAIDVAKLARERGLRGLVLKNHHQPTASMAYFARKLVPGLEVFGGITLNRAVGGINPVAVERMVEVKGGWGRVVWMPTFDAENHVRSSNESRPFVSVARDGRLLPEVLEVLDLVAKHKLTLATGHSSAAEALLLIREAGKRGVERILATHAMLGPINMTTREMQEAARLGAFIEFVYNALIGPDEQVELKKYADAIREIGPERCIVASDLGQAGNPLPPDGLAAFLEGLRKHGFSENEIERMAKVNPARLLGLP